MNCLFIALQKILKDEYDVDLIMNELYVLDASTSMRISFHVLLPFRFENDLERKVFERAVAAARGNSPNHEDFAFNGEVGGVRWTGRNGFLDESVFNINSLMRMVHCNKMNKLNWLKPINFLSEGFSS